MRDSKANGDKYKVDRENKSPCFLLPRRFCCSHNKQKSPFSLRGVLFLDR